MKWFRLIYAIPLIVVVVALRVTAAILLDAGNFLDRIGQRLGP